MFGLFSSKGLKRWIASVLAIIQGLVANIPGLQELLVYLTPITGVAGGLGVTHAITAGTLSKHKLTGLASLLAFLAAAATFFPALAPFTPILQQIAALVGAAGVGVAAGSKLEEVE